jgi:hypothetical protein
MHQCTFTGPSRTHASPWPLEAPRVIDAASAFRCRGGDAARHMPAEAADSGDFAFLHGRWLVENVRLAEPLADRPRTITYDAVLDCRPLLGGSAHIEEMTSEDGAADAILRLHEPHNRRWSVHRVSSADGTLDRPLRGGFTEGLGVFVGEAVWRGITVLVRETWRRDADGPHWEQSFSADGGETWRTHWVRRLIRVNWPD